MSIEKFIAKAVATENGSIKIRIATPYIEEQLLKFEQFCKGD